MLTSQRLLIAVAAQQAVTRHFGMSTIEMDREICPKHLFWPRSAAMALCLDAGLSADEIGRLFSCPAGVVAECARCVLDRIKKDEEWRNEVENLLDDFQEESNRWQHALFTIADQP